MLRIVFFLVAVAVVAFAAAWLADQSGDVVLTWSGWRADLSLPVFVLGLAAIVAAAIIVWTVVLALWRMPGRLRRGHHERRHARGRHAITQGLLAIGMGDAEAARRHSQAARRDAHQDPLALLLHAQTAQIEGDRDGARRAFRAMAERDDTRLLGLRGLFVEAQRADDLPAAVAIAEEALRLAPSSPWAAHAVLGFRCSSGDWNGALAILEARLASGRIDKAVYRRERGVLLTARALDLETSDRDASRDSAIEAVKLAPTLVPAAVLAAKFLSEAHQIRRAMRILETAWVAQPHPDLVEAYAHVRLGDSARQRLTRVETLAAKVPGHVEGALAIARQAIDAREFARAREVLAPLISAPTQRVAMLMAEIERAEHGDDGRARGWMLKALRAAHDPVWTADGYVSERWRPVSPVTGRLDAFQWQAPLAALPSDRPIDAEADRAIGAPRAALPAASGQGDRAATAPGGAAAAIAPAVTAAQDNAPPAAALPAPEAGRTAAPPLFRGQSGVRPAPAVPPVIPIVRAPDDPGVDDTEAGDEFGAAAAAPPAQRGGWRGFLSRFGA
jgi:HemY protein